MHHFHTVQQHSMSVNRSKLSLEKHLSVGTSYEYQVYVLLMGRGVCRQQGKFIPAL